MPTHLVTGGAGFIGTHIVAALVARGDEVRVVDDFSSGKSENLATVAGKINVVKADIAGELPTDLFDGVDTVFHHAALASVPLSVERPHDTHAVCVTGTLNLLDAARRAKVRRFVFASSSAIYGDVPLASKRESDPADPLSPYAAAKQAGEAYCKSFYKTFGLETVCLRYFNVFGPRQDPSGPYAAVIPLFIKRLLAGERPVIFGDGRQTRDFCYVENVVSANLLAAEASNAPGGVFNIGNGRSTDLLELLALLNQEIGSKVEPEFAPPRAGDVRDSLADITLARQTLGFDPAIDLAEGLKRCVAAHRAS